MPETVGQYPITAFATPVTNDPLDAGVVRGNDNTLRVGYVAHDADPGIHVQASLIASRPAAGVGGRKWITIDTDGTLSLWRDNGTAWVEVSGVPFALTRGQPPYFNAGNSGAALTVNWNNGPVQLVTITAACTISFSNPIAGGTFTLVLAQNLTGGFAVTLNGWNFGDNVPAYNTAASKRNVVVGLFDGSGSYLASFAVKGA